MLLEKKVAVIYGAGGAIGGAVAQAFIREGAKVFLTDHTQAKIDKISHRLHAKDGEVQTALIDALDERAVDTYVDRVVEQAGRIDISFDLISYGDVQMPLTEISVEDFLQPIMNAMRTQFLTSRAAARHMIKHGSGVILYFGGGGPQTTPGMGGFKVAFDAVESLRRQWAIELGQHGIRVVTLKTGGIPESIPETNPERDKIIESLLPATLLHRTATLDDVGNMAAIVASDLARSMTAADVNISCGAILD